MIAKSGFEYSKSSFHYHMLVYTDLEIKRGMECRVNLYMMQANASRIYFPEASPYIFNAFSRCAL